MASICDCADHRLSYAARNTALPSAITLSSSATPNRPYSLGKEGTSLALRFVSTLRLHGLYNATLKSPKTIKDAQMQPPGRHCKSGGSHQDLPTNR